MPLRFYPGDRIDSLLINQILGTFPGTGWLGGADASIVTDSADPIELSVDSGSIRIDGSDPININAQTVAIPEGDAQWPRRDVLYGDSDGTLHIEQGQPQPMDGATVEPETADTDSTDRMAQLSQPVPPDVLRLGGVPLWEIFVPARAQSATDLTALDGRELRDRRQAGVTDQSIAASHSELSDLLDDDHPQYLLTDGTRKADPSIVGGGNSGQVVTSDGTDSQWNSPAFVFQLPMTELDAAGDPDDSITDYIPCKNGVTLLNAGVVDDTGGAQSAVELEVDIPDSSADPITTTDTDSSAFLLYGSATTVSVTLTNTSASTAKASARVYYRKHAPF
jgi:hypothetical protein